MADGRICRAGSRNWAKGRDREACCGDRGGFARQDAGRVEPGQSCRLARPQTVILPGGFMYIPVYAGVSSGSRHATRTLALAFAALLGACAGEPSAPFPANIVGDAGLRISNAASARETASQRWIALTRAIVGRRELGPLGTARTFALVSVAQYNAVVAARQGKMRAVHPSEAHAAGAASAAVLAGLYPAEQTAIAAQTT